MSISIFNIYRNLSIKFTTCLVSAKLNYLLNENINTIEKSFWEKQYIIYTIVIEILFFILNLQTGILSDS